MHQLKEYTPGKNVGGVSIGALWCNFSATLLYRNVVNIVPCKTCMSEIRCKISWIIYNLVLTLRLCSQDYTPPSQMEKSGVLMLWKLAFNCKTKLFLTGKCSVPNAERSPRFN